MIEESNTDITENNRINSRVKEIDDSDLVVASAAYEIDVVVQYPVREIDHPDSRIVDVVAQELAGEIDNNADSGVVDVVAQEPAGEIDNNADSEVVDVVAPASVVENSPAVGQSDTYQTMIEASIKVLQNSVSLQEQLALNSHTVITKNLDVIYSKSKGRRVAGNNITNEVFQMLQKLFPEHHSLIQEMQEARSRKPDKTQKTRPLSSQYLNDVMKVVKSLQEISQG